ncbi:sensor histidine kinase [Alishewanella sp. SMS8]|uniref:sensor histidine kinase n=1 Tax=Alishewanella sp. SMS8 TaxID=2994676 RepID=UPI00274104FD|nr:histidine kinase [Alishewanella sp. SMS8]MDP5459431.1 histidine kinase [Alishewanella sp. SMS8]
MKKLQDVPRLELQLPDLTQGSHLLRVVVFSQALALILALAPYSSEPFWSSLGTISLFIHWISLGSCLVFSRLQPRLRFMSLMPFALAVQLILLSVTFVCSYLSFWFLQEGNNVSFWTEAANNLIIAFIVGLVLIQFLIMYDELARSITSQQKAKLSALQARIRPHFLFNSLNTVAELIHTDQDAAEQALLNLADLFRAAMASAENISLQDELALCKQYLALEQWRLGSRLVVNWQLPETIPTLNLPALTIQPLLENAVQYGFETRTVAGVLDIKVYLGKKQLSIVIENPVATSHKKQNKNGIAIANIQQRLKILFGQSAQLTTYELADMYRVKLVLPLEGE